MKFLVIYLTIFMLFAFGCGKSPQLKKINNTQDFCKNTNFHKNIFETKNLLNIFNCLELNKKYPKTNSYLKFYKNNPNHFLNKLNEIYTKNESETKSLLDIASDKLTNKEIESIKAYFINNLENDHILFLHKFLKENKHEFVKLLNNIRINDDIDPLLLRNIINELHKEKTFQSFKEVMATSQQLIILLDKIFEKDNEKLNEFLNYSIKLLNDKDFINFIRRIDLKIIESIFKEGFLKQQLLSQDLELILNRNIVCVNHDQKQIVADVEGEIEAKTNFFLLNSFDDHQDSIIELFIKKEIIFADCGLSLEFINAINRIFNLVIEITDNEVEFNFMQFIIRKTTSPNSIWNYFISEEHEKVSQLLSGNANNINVFTDLLKIIRKNDNLNSWLNNFLLKLVETEGISEFKKIWGNLSDQDKVESLEFVSSNFNKEMIVVLNMLLEIESVNPGSFLKLIDSLNTEFKLEKFIDFIDDILKNEDEIINLLKSEDLNRILKFWINDLEVTNKLKVNIEKKQAKILLLEPNLYQGGLKQCFQTIKNNNKDTIWDNFFELEDLCDFSNSKFVVNKIFFELMVFQNDYYLKFQELNPLVNSAILVDSFWYFLSNKSFNEDFYDHLYEFLDSMTEKFYVFKILPDQIELQSQNLNDLTIKILNSNFVYTPYSFYECHIYFVNDLGVNPCNNNESLLNSISFIRSKLLNAQNSENPIALITQWLFDGIEIPRGIESRKHKLTLKEFVQFIFNASDESTKYSIFHHSKSGVVEVKANLLERLELVIRDIGFINNFYGAFFKNKLSKSVHYQESLKSLKKQLKLMVGSAGFFRSVNIYPDKTRYLLKNVFNSYDSLIEVDNEFPQIDGSVNKYGDMVQAILTLLVRSSKEDTIDFNPYQKPNETVTEGHNGIILTELMNLSLFRHLSIYLRTISDNKIENIINDPEFKLISENLSNSFNKDDFFDFLNYTIQHKNFLHIVQDLIELNSTERQKIVSIIKNILIILINNKNILNKDFYNLIKIVVADYQKMKTLNFDNINLNNLLNFTDFLKKDEFKITQYALLKLFAQIKHEQLVFDSYAPFLELINSFAKFYNLEKDTLVEYAGISSNSFTSTFEHFNEFLNAENRNEILDYWSESGKLQTFLNNLMGKNKTEILDYIFHTKSYVEAI
jgi:hypothetical protein